MSIITESLILESEISQLALANYGVKLLNHSVFAKNAFYKVNNYAYQLGIVDDYKKADIKKLFYNFYILELCDYIKSDNVKLKPVLFFNEFEDYSELPVDLNFSKISNYIVRKLKTLLPLGFLNVNLNINEFDRLIKLKDAEYTSILIQSINKSQQIDALTFTYSNLKKFLKNNNLVYLNNTYFNQLQTKLALLT